MNFINSQREFDRNVILQSFQQLSHESQQRVKRKKIKNNWRHSNITDDFTGVSSSGSSSESKETFQTSLIEGLNYVQQQQSNDITNCSQSSGSSLRKKQPVRLLDTYQRSETPPRLNSYKLHNDSLDSLATPQVRNVKIRT